MNYFHPKSVDLFLLESTVIFLKNPFTVFALFIVRGACTGPGFSLIFPPQNFFMCNIVQYRAILCSIVQ